MAAGNVTPPDGDNPVYGDPLFLDPAGDNYHITVTVASAARIKTSTATHGPAAVHCLTSAPTRQPAVICR
jgi:hypothetical protein